MGTVDEPDREKARKDQAADVPGEGMDNVGADTQPIDTDTIQSERAEK